MSRMASRRPLSLAAGRALHQRPLHAGALCLGAPVHRGAYWTSAPRYDRLSMTDEGIPSHAQVVLDEFLSQLRPVRGTAKGLPPLWSASERTRIHSCYQGHCSPTRHRGAGRPLACCSSCRGTHYPDCADRRSDEPGIRPASRPLQSLPDPERRDEVNQFLGGRRDWGDACSSLRGRNGRTCPASCGARAR